MEYKLIYSNYNTETGESIVTIKTNIGNFSGKAFLNPVDKDNESKFFGCRIAEYRAVIKYTKGKLHRLNLELNELSFVIKSMPIDTKWYRYLKKRIKRKEELIIYYKKIKKILQEHIIQEIENRDKILEEIKRKKENK